MEKASKKGKGENSKRYGKISGKSHKQDLMESLANLLNRLKAHLETKGV